MSEAELPPPHLVSDAPALGAMVERLLGEELIAVDTEANSMFAYQERLCLVQVSSAEEDWLIDPLAGLDLAPLGALFASERVQKVFHDAEFDVLTLKRAARFRFAAVFDTRVAAASLGHAQVGLAALLHECMGVRLDKRFQRSDWGRRPLSAGQLDYARRDTRYLPGLARRLRAELDRRGGVHVEEVDSECRRIAAVEPEPRSFDPEGWTRIAGAERLDAMGRRLLRALFAWRDREAERRDQPHFKVLGNEAMLTLAQRAASGVESPAAVPGVPAWIAPALAALLDEARAAGPLSGSFRRAPTPEEELSPAQRRVFDALRAWRREVAARRPVDPALVLPRGALLALARRDSWPRDLAELAACGVLEEWRLRRYGAGILAALRG
ncbi:MAG: HRDC domain-containing protein [Planctomycetes bacterium]|nr:HRDC domain-containing protein [Planctomycetota bacterium]